MYRVLTLIILSAGLMACSNTTQVAVRDGEGTPIAPPVNPSIKTQGQVYTVQPGDTLYSIAWNFSLDYRDLAAINNIPAPYILESGQKLRLSGSPSGASSQLVATESSGVEVYAVGTPAFVESSTTVTDTQPVATEPAPAASTSTSVLVAQTTPPPNQSTSTSTAAPTTQAAPNSVAQASAATQTSSSGTKTATSTSASSTTNKTTNTTAASAQNKTTPPAKETKPVAATSTATPAATSSPSAATAATPAPSTAKVASAAEINAPVTKWVWPANGRVTRGFSGSYKGIDIEGPRGEPIHATAAGQVVYSGTGLRGYGQLIIIKHNTEFLSAYAHNSVVLVAEGDTVKQGQKIAEMGDSGTNKVKLHFELRLRGKPVDPQKYLPRR